MSLRIIAGSFKGRKLKAPKTSRTRPTQSQVREAIFNMCQTQIEGSAFLDLFAGSGAIGFEALSRGAEKVTFLEKQKEAIQCIEENAKILKVESKIRILKAPFIHGISLLKKEKKLFDLIYLDPPYEMEIDLLLLTSLMHEKTLLFLERHFEPKQQKKLLLKDELILEKTKRFASTEVCLLSLKSN